MSRYERMQFFETLCDMQATYATRPDGDRLGDISVDDAIAYAEAVMFAIEVEAEEGRVFDELQARVEPAATGDLRD